MIDTAAAVNSLRPNTEWSMSGDDVENILWITEGVEPLTQSEVNAEIVRLQNLEDQKPILKAALLERLGLTADEAKLLLS